jgi:Mitochondrial genome maintenance MGM101
MAVRVALQPLRRAVFSSRPITFARPHTQARTALASPITRNPVRNASTAAAEGEPVHTTLVPAEPEYATELSAIVGHAFPGSIDWTTSYHGVATRPFSKEVVDILMRPLKSEDIEVKPDGILYLPEIKYRRILHEAFGPGGWGMIPKSEPVVGDKVVTREYVLIADGR